jgi:hypothetical protein
VPESEQVQPRTSYHEGIPAPVREQPQFR